MQLIIYYNTVYIYITSSLVKQPYSKQYFWAIKLLGFYFIKDS